jgi:hypothetical protein
MSESSKPLNRNRSKDLPVLSAEEKHELDAERLLITEALLRCWQRLALMSPLQAAVDTGLDNEALDRLAHASFSEIRALAEASANSLTLALSPSMVASTLGDGDANLVEQLCSRLAIMPGLMSPSDV